MRPISGFHLIVLFLIFCSPFYLHAQPRGSENKPWKSFWIAVPQQPEHDYGVYQFRKTFELGAKPDSFIIHVSADNRYKLYVNGVLVSLGPARGDIYYWNYETVNIASFLQPGKNVLAAVVWNYGDYRPEAQISWQTGFILEGDRDPEQIVNTNNSWRCRRDSSYSPKQPRLIYSYYVAGPGETIDFNKSIANWKSKEFDDASWPVATTITEGLPKGAFGFGLGWMLVPRMIPQMELTEQRLQKTRQVNGINLPADFPSERASVTIPAHSTISFLLDQGFLTDAYPVIRFSEGKDATITLGYAEGLYVEEPEQPDWRRFHQKGNRDDVTGKRFIGVSDSLISNGSEGQEFSSLWWRTYRYMRVEVTTREKPLVINDLFGIFTGYPFTLNAHFDAANDTLSRILETGWRTARSCAMETYMDCPYYEQLQYVGDTRIQCLVSLYNSGDDRLMKNAINLIDESRMAEGATLSRYPTAHAQEIPPFSLWWIGMIHDYWMYRNDEPFVRSKLPGIRQVLWFFSKYQQADGSLKNVPYWNFTDWCETKGWVDGVGPVGSDGNSAILDFQLLWAYQLASELEERLGMKEFADRYRSAAARLKQTILRKYWDEHKKIFADTHDKDVFSQHANALAILTGTIGPEMRAALAEEILHDSLLTQATIYFKFYVHQALTIAGLGNQYLNWLGVWKQNLAMGMTTWAEISDINNTRSDCHAWGASPNIELYRIVLGIDSDAPGFKRIRITPHPGNLSRLSGNIPHPDGTISAVYEKKNGRWIFNITLPQHTPGYLVWKNIRHELKPGSNSLQIAD